MPAAINNQFDTLAGFRRQAANDFFQIASTTNDDGQAFLNFGMQDCRQSETAIGRDSQGINWSPGIRPVRDD